MISGEDAYPAVTPVPTADLVRVFGDLEELVVSLDRIMSRIGSGADPQILVDYLVDRSLFPRLARARGDLGDALAASLGEAEVERIAEGKYWFSSDG
ncbi:hypothetical protein VSH64_31085 [Amycolatopsis rhabdoformis]|uniref:Uncharacterized protein n=1 Tax=Amycolatopsis rhabdoformis TaxID=1448059 RepID=A0ABZ1HYM3_9PSEU|nr:hypothetical protein [Amycolatopsis rhabdoformis]WSE27292.1 hypothetical protein VSH64_31085 [Amycolatopsis rhabdoformis]